MERCVLQNDADTHKGDWKRMSQCGGQFENICKPEFDAISEKLDRLDEAIRGNGKPGIQLRLDRLEVDAKRQSKLIWMILGACLTAAVSATTAWIAG